MWWEWDFGEINVMDLVSGIVSEEVLSEGRYRLAVVLRPYRAWMIALKGRYISAMGLAHRLGDWL